MQSCIQVKDSSWLKLISNWLEKKKVWSSKTKGEKSEELNMVIATDGSPILHCVKKCTSILNVFQIFGSKL